MTDAAQPDPAQTDPARPPRSAERAEGDPAGEEGTSGRTPRPDQPAEGEDVPGGGADTP
ncbi:hypothetical protein ACI79C_19480 [Geodermatophilus sp. SYSU D00697]